MSSPAGERVEFSRSLTRTIRALGLIGKPISARSLAGSFSLGPTIAALRWLLEIRYVATGTSPTAGRHREPVYWLTDDGLGMYRNLLRRSISAGQGTCWRD
ncbi:hypothetical protein K7711_38305 [Nocardia sp. CA2R105]|uniref:hypothetical protein n=1 Tax=Nocardia coffeae TaxID=2873381 RepID=UPI001CA77B55|nr:hypothetical protein [Nocardia coffeae]MBY8862377.1 hypothetical protein [Nocardia coffeae]